MPNVDSTSDERTVNASDVSMDDLARTWGAHDWADAQRLIDAGYAFYLETRAGYRVNVLVDRQTMRVAGTIDEVRARLDAQGPP